MPKFLLYPLVSLLLSAGIVWAGNTTLTTYYPAPTGNYNQLIANNIGIGTTSPVARLHVTVPAAQTYPTLGTASGSIFLAGSTNLWGMYSGLADGPGGAWIQVMRGDSAIAYNLALQPVGGNVGIGTTSPGQKLDVAGWGRFEGSSGGNYGDSGAIEFYNSNTNSSNVQAQIKALRGPNDWKAGQLAFFTAAPSTGALSQQMTIDQSGNVGIGTTTPTSLLTLAQNSSINWINGNSYTWGIQKITNDLAIKYGSGADPTTGTAAMYFQGSSGNVGIGTQSPIFQLQDSGSASIGGPFIAQNAGSNGYYDSNGTAYHYTPMAMIRSDSSSTALNGTQSALVLYNSSGATNSWTKLALANNETAATNANPVSIAGIASQMTSGVANGWASGDLILWTKYGGNENEVMRATSSGNVGIGTTAPRDRLDLNDNGTMYLKTIHFVSNDNGTSGDNTDPYLLEKVHDSYNNSHLDLQLNDDYNEEFRIYGYSCNGYGCGARSGNLYHFFRSDGTAYHAGPLGIGTLTPIRTLTVSGGGGSSEMAMVSTNANAFINGSDPSGNNGNSYNINIRGLINGGSAGANLAGLYLYANSVWAPGTITAASDGRLKQNIKPLTNTLSKLDRLRGVSFQWNHLAATSVGNKEGQKAIGMIAQELQKVYPELVVASKNGNQEYLSIDYGKFTAVLLQAVKELKKEKDKEIKDQGKEIHALKEENRDIKAVLCRKLKLNEFCQ